MTGNVLTINGISCSYDDRSVLQDIDLQLQPGRITAVLGRSGCGKSTLLRAIAGFEPVRSGSITLGERELSRPGLTLPSEQRNIGIVVQSFALFPHLTVWKNITFGARADGQKDRARGLLAKVGLQARADAYPHELSGGEKQRIALVRALVPQPEVVLLDEAFSSLDRDLRETLRRDTAQILRESGVAACIVTHDAEEALEIADHLAILRGGRIVQQGRGDDIFWRPVDEETARLLGDVNAIDARVADKTLHTAFGSVPLTEALPEGAVRLLVRPSAVSLRAAGENDIAATITGTQFSGAVSAVSLEASDGTQLRACMADTQSWRKGDQVAATFDLSRAAIVLV